MKMRNKNGQAAAVGAMLTFMILLLILSIIMLYYVPVLLKERESLHMREVEKGFLELASRVSNYILTGDKTTESKIAIPLGSEGIPILAPGTFGTLKIEPYSSRITISNSTRALATGMGSVKFNSQSIYYTRQNYIYENGAVLLEQPEGTSIKAPPEFNLTSGKLTLTLITLVGTNQTLGGQATQTLNIKLDYCESLNYEWSSENITINITTQHTKAWSTYFNTTLAPSTSGEDYAAVTIQGIKQLELKFAAVEVKIVSL